MKTGVQKKYSNTQVYRLLPFQTHTYFIRNVYLVLVTFEFYMSRCTVYTPKYEGASDGSLISATQQTISVTSLCLTSFSAISSILK